MSYLYFKAFHIIGVIVWFAGLFYLGRLFVYHREADERPESEREVLKSQFALMERRLYYGITWPGLCISVLFGSLLWWEWGFASWINEKFALVVLLIVYHLWCGKLRIKLLKNESQWTGKQFRLFNEVPTLLLFAIIFIVIFKEAFSWAVFIPSLAGLAVIIGVVVQWFALRRKAKNKEQNRDQL